MSVIRSLAGGGSTGNILRTTGPAPTGPGLVPNIAGLQQLGAPILDPVVGTLSATDAARYNLFRGSEVFDTDWSITGGGSITANAVVAPNGQQTADTFTTAVAGENACRHILSANYAAGVAYTLSCHAKQGTGRYARLRFTSENSGAIFDLQTGTVANADGTTASMVDAGNGWWRCISTLTTTGSAQLIDIGVNETTGSSAISTAGLTVHFWGAQFETGSSATAYIQSPSGATASADDSASIAGTVLGDPTGTLAATESGNDSASITGTVLVEGPLAATEAGADTANIAGGPTVSGQLSATEAGADAASVSGTVLVAGPLAATEAAGADTAAATGTVLVAGPLAATEGAGQDAASITGSVAVAGPLAATESGTDAASITGSVSDGATGTLDATETGTDTATVAGDVAVSGSQDALESGSDAAGLTATVAVEGALAASEAGQDTASILEAAPAVIEEEPRRGGPALLYRRDLRVSRDRPTRKRTLDEILAELLPAHGSEAKPAPIVSSSRSRDKAGDADRARAGRFVPSAPRAPSIAASAAVQASRVVQEARQRRAIDAEVLQLAQQIMEHEHRVVRRRRATAAALLLSSPL